jgi:hypothetical protein
VNWRDGRDYGVLELVDDTAKPREQQKVLGYVSMCYGIITGYVCGIPDEAVISERFLDSYGSPQPENYEKAKRVVEQIVRCREKKGI